MKDLTKRQIRYICFRLQTEAEGGNTATSEETGVMSFVEKIKKHMESQDDFGGWKMFAKTWDVDEKSPLVVVKRTSSIYSDWNNVLKKGAKDFPEPPTSTKIIEMPTSPEEKKTATLRDASGKFVKKTEQQTQTTKIIETPTPDPKSSKKSFWDNLK